jgi:5-formyltetrahydrofolate cyclo-ligase
MKKSELRHIYLEKRRALSPERHSEKSRQIAQRFFREIDLSSRHAIDCFISMAHTGEVETRLIFNGFWRRFPEIETFAPRIGETTGVLEAVRYTSSTKLEPNKWSIPEPIDGDIVDPAAIDLVVVPLLCFDSRGHRVGYGKGFYDRFLKECRPDCVRVGLSFFPPIEQIDDVHAGDIPLDVCITPDETYRF